MRKEILRITCDRCGADIEWQTFPVAVFGEMDRDDLGQWAGHVEVKQADLCPECFQHLQRMLWIRENEEFGKAEALVEKMVEPEPEEAEQKPKPKKRIDYGKVDALAKAGWSATKIADEMKMGVSTVYKYLSAKGEE